MTKASLSLTTRWPLALGLTLLVVVGRLLLHLFLWKREGAPSTPSILPSFAVRTSVQLENMWGRPCSSSLSCCLLFPAATNAPSILAIYILTYVMLGWGLNIVVGLAGLLDLGYVAFYAVGAYSYALLSTVYLPLWFGDGIVPWAFYVTLPLAGLLAATWGVILGFPVLRLRGDYLAIVTLGLR